MSGKSGGEATTGPLLLAPAARLAVSHTALLVVDMQNDFCAPGGYIERVMKRDPGPCAAVAEPIGRLAAAARKAGVPVFWLRADYRIEMLPANMQARLAERGITEPCCVPGEWGYDWFGVTPAPGESVTDKRCYDGFVGTDLAAALDARHVRTIVFAGVQTNICVEATLRHAHALGYHCVVAEDCVASHMASAHEDLLTLVRFALGDVLPAAEIAKLWAPSR